MALYGDEFLDTLTRLEIQYGTPSQAVVDALVYQFTEMQNCLSGPGSIHTPVHLEEHRQVSRRLSDMLVRHGMTARAISGNLRRSINMEPMGTGRAVDMGGRYGTLQ